MVKDFRSKIDCRCYGCGAKGSEVTWAQLGSSYENGHLESGSVPDVCGPFLLTADYEAYKEMAVTTTNAGALDAQAFFEAAVDRFTDQLDLLEHGVGA